MESTDQPIITIERPQDLPAAGDVSGQVLIKPALQALRTRVQQMRVYRRYYDGQHPLTYASEAYREYFAQMVSKYRENLAPAVIDAITDRLTVTGVSISTNEAPEDTETPIPQGQQPDVEPAPTVRPEDAIAAQLWAMWQTNRLDLRSDRVHRGATRDGDSFVLVWEDPEIPSSPRVYPQDAWNVVVHYDPETEVMDWAAKFWMQTDKRGRCTLYFRDRIERYITVQQVKTAMYGLPSGNSDWRPFAGDATGPVVDNPYDRVPMFHFANDADIGEYGKSELTDVVPIQDALNKSVADMLVGMEFAAYPQRWATGMQVENDPVTGKPRAFKPGVDRVWQTDSEQASFGSFEAIDLDQLINVQNRFKSAAADVAGIPAHYMQMTPGEWPSGESLKTSEARFVAKVAKRQKAFGATWSQVVDMMAAIAGIEVPGMLDIQWTNPSPRSDMDAVLIAQGKKLVGVTDEQNQRELGYTEEEIARMAEESDAAATKALERQQELASDQPFGNSDQE